MSLIRVLFGFVVACMAGAATLVLFVYTPAELASLPSDIGTDRVIEAALFALVVAPHVMLFATLPALLSLIYAERNGIGSWGYYVLLGLIVATLGFLAQHFSEAPGQATILQNYALTAFLVAGVIGGFAYWLLSGRFAAAAPPAKARPAPLATAAQ